MRQTKDLVAAIILTVLFGPFGLFYASLLGGSILTFISGFFIYRFFKSIFIPTSAEELLTHSNITADLVLIPLILIPWALSIVWAVISVHYYNQQVIEDNYHQQKIDRLSEN